MIYDVNGNVISAVYELTGTGLEEAYDLEGNPLLEPPTPIGRTIQMTKLENTYQFRWPFDGQTMGWTIINYASENGGMDGGAFVVGTEPVDKTTIMTGWFYKSFLDDICPLHYNGSFRGAGHGEDTTWSVVMDGITPSAADIGTVWRDANSRDFVCYTVTDTALLLISEFTGNDAAPVSKATPVAPLTCQNDNRTASTITATKKMMHPDINNRTFSVTLADNTAVTVDGVYESTYIDVYEKYNILNLKDMITHLKANVGSNTASSYYANTIGADFEYTQRYRVLPDGVCVVYVNLVPKRQGLYLDSFGATQVRPMGAVINIPFTDDYNTLYTQPDNVIIDLIPSTWEDPTFPPYKATQFRTDYSGKYGFEWGFCLDFGDAVPSVRDDISSALYVFTSKVMYPRLYAADPAVDVYGHTITGYVYRVPVCKSAGYTVVQYEAGGNKYAEIDFYESFDSVISLNEIADGTAVTVVKANSGVTSVGNTVSSGGVTITAAAYGSATLRLGQNVAAT